jgi:hypothetical protein
VLRVARTDPDDVDGAAHSSRSPSVSR